MFLPQHRNNAADKKTQNLHKYTFLIPSIQLHIFSVHSQKQSLDDKHLYIYTKRDKKKGCDLILRFRKREGDYAVQ